MSQNHLIELPPRTNKNMFYCYMDQINMKIVMRTNFFQILQGSQTCLTKFYIN